MSIPRARQRRAILALVLAAWSTVGCAATRTHAAPYARLTSPRDNVRVTLVSGEEHHLWSAMVRNDSVVGTRRIAVRPGDVATEDEHWRRYREMPASLPLSSVRTIQSTEVDGTRTVVMLVAVVGAVAAFLAMAMSSLDMGLQLESYQGTPGR